MRNASYKCEELIPRAGKIPWITFVFLGVVFFMVQHDLFQSLTTGTGNLAQDIAKRVALGDVIHRVTLSVLGIFGAVGLMRRGTNLLKIHGALGWLSLFFLIWAFSSLAWADDTVLTLRKLAILAMLTLGALAVTKHFSLRDIVLWVFFSSTSYLLIGLLVEIVLGTFRPFGLDYRFAGTLHPNSQGTNCALLFFSGITAARITKHGRSLFWAFAVIGLIFLVLTKSRTAFASTILALFFYWGLTLSSSRKLISIMGVSVVFCLLLIIFGEAIFPIFWRAIIFGREENISTLTCRVPLWAECAKYVARHPIRGYGFGGFWTPGHVEEISNVVDWGIGASHSAYLELILNLGIIGMVAYVLILVVSIVQSCVLYRTLIIPTYSFFAIVLIFCALDGLLESGFLDPAPINFLCIVSFVHFGFGDRRFPHK